MKEQYIEDQIFSKINYQESGWLTAEYEACEFHQCNFSDTDLSNSVFSDCVFKGCNLSMAKLNNTAFRDIKFVDCKLQGLRFDDCNEFLFAASFDNCLLNLSSFFQRKMKKAIFKKSSLMEVDFVEADLSQSIFDDCDLSGALFDRTNLEKADLRTAEHFNINPETNRIKKRNFRKEDLRDYWEIMILRSVDNSPRERTYSKDLDLVVTAANS